MNKNNTNAVPLNTTTFNTRLLNTTKLNTNGFPVLSKRSGSSADISQAIMDSLVCWYDIGKQQCTNESMAANPVLADLSGNGHDIECFNFAWAGMSGIGMYTNFYNDSSRADIEKLGEQHWYINSIFTGNSVNSQCILKATEQFPEYFCGKSLKITLTGNVLDGTEISFSSDLKSNLHEGENIVEIPDITEITNRYITLKFPLETTNVEVEISPLYPNALVSDGVDDYCYTDGLPILTDYTVIAKRKWLGFTGNCALASKFKNNGLLTGAFGLEHIGTNNLKEYWIFGVNNRNVLYPEEITYGTPTLYNGVPVNRGNASDNEVLSLFSMRENSQTEGQIALYSFLLFDRTLTTAEIEWVKKNMIESGGVLATNWADSSLWKNYLDGSRGIGVIKSTKIIINANIIGVSALFETIGERTIDSFTIKVTGLQNDIILYYKYNNGSSEQLLATMIEDGVYTLPQVSGKYIGFMFNKKFENENIVIQQLLSE